MNSDTKIIQDLLDAGGRVDLPSGIYEIDTPLLPRSNSVIDGNNIYLKRAINTPSGFVLLYLKEVENISLRSMTVDGKCGETGRGRTGENEDVRAHNIAIQGCRDISLAEILSINAPTSPEGGSYGDGLAIWYGDDHSIPTDIEIENLYTTQNGRGGLSMLCGKNITFRECQFVNEGRWPDCGAANLETNEDFDWLESTNILFDGCEFADTLYAVTANNHGSAKRNFTWLNCKFTRNRADGFSGGDRHVNSCPHVFDGCVFDGNHGAGLSLYQGNMIVRDCKFINNGAIGIVAMETSLEVDDSIIVGNQNAGIHVSGTEQIVQKMIVKDCLIQASMDAVLVQADTALAFPKTITNTVVSNCQNGISSYGVGARGIVAWGCTFINVGKVVNEWQDGDANTKGTTVIGP